MPAVQHIAQIVTNIAVRSIHSHPSIAALAVLSLAAYRLDMNCGYCLKLSANSQYKMRTLRHLDDSYSRSNGNRAWNITIRYVILRTVTRIRV